MRIRNFEYERIAKDKDSYSFVLWLRDDFGILDFVASDDGEKTWYIPAEHSEGCFKSFDKAYETLVKSVSKRS